MLTADLGADRWRAQQRIGGALRESRRVSIPLPAIYEIITLEDTSLDEATPRFTITIHSRYGVEAFPPNADVFYSIDVLLSLCGTRAVLAALGNGKP